MKKYAYYFIFTNKTPSTNHVALVTLSSFIDESISPRFSKVFVVMKYLRTAVVYGISCAPKALGQYIYGNTDALATLMTIEV